MEYGFRLPSAYDNRPLFFDEFRQRINQVVYVSATPAEYELGRAQRIAEQLIRPTGLVDPEIEVRPIAGQVDDVMGEIRERAKKDQRVLVTTLTTKMAEDLTDYLSSNGIRVRYLHHRIETVERMEIIRDLRAGIFDVLVGINLLREGLDIPEVSLVAILDADKEGLFRSATSLIQTVGRAARNAEGKVIMYADSVTKSMDVAITETNRRREKQLAFNRENNIVPKTIVKEIRDPIDIGLPAKSSKDGRKRVFTPSERDGIPEIIERLTKQMRAAAKALEFERAAYLRDTIEELQKEMKNTDGTAS